MDGDLRFGQSFSARRSGLRAAPRVGVSGQVSTISESPKILEAHFLAQAQQRRRPATPNGVSITAKKCCGDPLKSLPLAVFQSKRSDVGKTPV